RGPWGRLRRARRLRKKGPKGLQGHQRVSDFCACCPCCPLGPLPSAPPRQIAGGVEVEEHLLRIAETTERLSFQIANRQAGLARQIVKGEPPFLHPRGEGGEGGRSI